MSIIGDIRDEYESSAWERKKKEILQWSGLENCKRNRKYKAQCCETCPFKVDVIMALNDVSWYEIDEWKKKHGFK